MNGSLNTAWIDLVEKFKARNTRERWLIAIAVLSVFYGLFTVLVSPILEKQKRINTELVTESARLDALNTEMVMFSQKSLAQKDSPEQQRIAALQEELSTVEKSVDDAKNSLVSPDKMPDLLSDLLKKNTRLKLVALKTLPIKDLFEKDLVGNEMNAANQIPNGLPIFKHGVEMTIEGRYLDLLEYVANVEKMPWHVLWERANLVVDAQSKNATPVSQLTLSVYTLSLDKAWLSI